MTIDYEYYQRWYEHESVPALKKTPPLESRGVLMQQDDASPHRRKGAEEVTGVGKDKRRDI